MAHKVAKCKKQHTSAKELILPAAINTVNIRVDELAGELLSAVPSSNNTNNCEIQYEQLIAKLNGREYSLPFDEFTRINIAAHLICYVRFVNNNYFVGDLLFCKSIVSTAVPHNSLDVINNFLVEFRMV